MSNINIGGQKSDEPTSETENITNLYNAPVEVI